ncbi:MAG: ATP-binding protein [Arachnia sp.]
MSWGTKMFLTQAMVLAASIATAGLVASSIGPRLFHGHLVQIGQELGSEEFAHIERAFIDAGVVSLAAGLTVALVVALVVSWHDTGRLRRPLDQLTSAATKVSAGDFAVRVPATGFSSELDAVGNAFNGMAHRLAATEETRRRLLADVSHEVRTPIATLTALLEAVADDITPWNHETLKLLMLQTERLQRIARDLDAVSRAEEGRLSLLLEAADMGDLVDRAAATASGRYRVKKVALEQHVDQLAVVVDPQRVGQVLGNLLDNALRHTPPGGSVRVDGARRGDTTVVTVTDTGDGLTADQLDQVFERFYRADAARARDAAGAGIGLTISRSLAIAHGGSLTAASAGPGQGSVFTLTLPSAPRSDSS